MQVTTVNTNGDIAGFREIFVNGVLLKQGARQIIKPLPAFDNLVPTKINDTGDLAGLISVEASDFPFDAAAFIVKGATGTTVTQLTRAGCCFGRVGLSLNKARKARSATAIMLASMSRTLLKSSTMRGTPWPTNLCVRQASFAAALIHLHLLATLSPENLLNHHFETARRRPARTNLFQ